MCENIFLEENFEFEKDQNLEDYFYIFKALNEKSKNLIKNLRKYLGIDYH